MSGVTAGARRGRALLAGVCCGLALLCASPVALALPTSADAGWHTWRVAAVDDAPGWCCVNRDEATAHNARCDLDKDQGYHNALPAGAAAPTHMQIYALARGGRWHSVRALRPDCPVSAATPITDHGTANAGASVALLARVVTPRGPASSHALGAIGVHRGPEARTVLVETAHGDEAFANRKDAVFWIGQLRSADSGDELRRLMFEDASTDLRAHAAFSWSQSRVADKAAALIRLGTTDASAHVRSQAWFWLAQTGAPESEQAIRRALVSDGDGQVREQAIFALSQLPAERGVQALIGVLEDPSSRRGDRKQALFWLAQSEEPAAARYLERVLAH